MLRFLLPPCLMMSKKNHKMKSWRICSQAEKPGSQQALERTKSSEPIILYH